ncbi:MAG: hypothetical protein JXR48_05665 [Candidatus Delongbacteria bacterium]|nr:hypothetical protein [Candidatus Delongbacteria bacterium]MBN2834437.1 hypothetical protein [Candidatus Delongbacteria bacterium]
MKIVLLLFLTSTILIGADRYISINRSLYSYFEYKILKDQSRENDDGNSNIFILNQPFKTSQVNKFLDKEIVRSLSNYSKENSSLKVKLSPGLGTFISNEDKVLYHYFNGDINLSIGNLSLVSNARVDGSVKYDPYFHGDTGETAMGYFDEAYGLYNFEYFDLFTGRVSRNWGALNEYGLILSDNPYSYDHFGISARNKKFMYSFYFTRLNDLKNGLDFQSVVIPDTLENGDPAPVNVKRYWSIQRIDFRHSDNLQMAFTQGAVYGGPDQDFVPAYLSPFNVFYVSQRNQNRKSNVQMSFYLDASIYYRPIEGIGFYLDLFIDDLVVNNEDGQDDRANHPDRLALQFKSSFTDLLLENSMTNLTYTRVWNDSYTTYRNFENYTFFDKSMGYPYNSYESFKISNSYFGFENLIIGGGVEYWRRGNRDVFNLFDGEIDSFPVPPVTEGINLSLLSSMTYFGLKAELEGKLLFITKCKNEKDYEELSRSKYEDVNYNLSFNLVYDFFLKYD